jgi:hypothetical protein
MVTPNPARAFDLAVPFLILGAAAMGVMLVAALGLVLDNILARVTAEERRLRSGLPRRTPSPRWSASPRWSSSPRWGRSTGEPSRCSPPATLVVGTRELAWPGDCRPVPCAPLSRRSASWSVWCSSSARGDPPARTPSEPQPGLRRASRSRSRCPPTSRRTCRSPGGRSHHRGNRYPPRRRGSPSRPSHRASRCRRHRSWRRCPDCR